MPRIVWILVAVGCVALALAIVSAALLLASDSSTETRADETVTLGEPPPRLELPIASDSGALMLAKRRRTVLVGVGVTRGAAEVAVVRGENAVSRGDLRFRADGAPVDTTPCGYGCSRLSRPVRRALEVSVADEPFRFALPARFPPAATATYRRATRTMRALRGYRYRETLTSGVGGTSISTFAVQPPDRLRLRTRDGFQSILIDDTRWDLRAGKWERSAFPGFRASFMWDGARHARLLDAERGLQVVAVFDRNPVPAWFELYVDRNSRIVRADMLAPSHFMEQRFHSFDAPIRIVPPR